jgi:DNA polymerase/3'-5' exonuclease PolX
MSTSLVKRTHREALDDAEAFRAMFPAHFYQCWEFAGSLRRGRPDVSDIEHVVIPRYGEVPGDDLFGTPKHVNLLWHRLEQLLWCDEGDDRPDKLAKHLYGVDPVTGEGNHRWGAKYRGVDFCGFNNEIFLADPDNWGNVLAIRTGPAEFSHSLMINLQQRGYWQNEGYLHDKRDIRCTCGWTGSSNTIERTSSVPGDNDQSKYTDGNKNRLACPSCRLGKNLTIKMIPVPDERTYLELAGVGWIEPEDRR